MRIVIIDKAGLDMELCSSSTMCHFENMGRLNRCDRMSHFWLIQRLKISYTTGIFQDLILKDLILKRKYQGVLSEKVSSLTQIGH